MRGLRRVEVFVFGLMVLLTVMVLPLRGQEVHAAPDQFDYYLLNLSWAPEFCHNVEMLPPGERFDSRKQDAAKECSTPHGFVLHGLWPQNFNGTWPANCADRPGPADYTPYLKDTPSLSLLRHEWAKHGTCTTLPPDRFFQAADRAFESVRVPAVLQNTTTTLLIEPDKILSALYQANPAFPTGSIVLSCGRNSLTAVNVCLSRNGLRPIACQNLLECGATKSKVAPEVNLPAPAYGHTNHP